MNDSVIRELGQTLASAGATTGTQEDPKTVSYGGRDLTQYAADLEKMGLAITEVRGGTARDNAGGHDVLFVRAYNAKTGVTVEDYLMRNTEDGKTFDSRDVVNRDIHTNNYDLHVYGGRDYTGIFALNVENASVEGRNVVGVNLTNLNDYTARAVENPVQFRSDATPGIERERRHHPVPTPNADLGPRGDYFFNPAELPVLPKDTPPTEQQAQAAAQSLRGSNMADVERVASASHGPAGARETGAGRNV